MVLQWLIEPARRAPPFGDRVPRLNRSAAQRLWLQALQGEDKMVAYKRPGSKSLILIAGIAVLFVVIFFAAPTLMAALNPAVAHNPSAASQTTHDRDVAKSGNPT